MAHLSGVGATVISSVTGFLALCIVILRLWTRLHILKNMGREDYLIAIAMLLSIGLTICVGIQAKYGMGQHIWTLSPEVLENSLKAFWVSLYIYNAGLGCIKISIVLQYIRIFTTRRFRMLCYITLALVLAYSIWGVFSSIFTCTPIRLFWDKTVPGHCFNQFVLWFINAGFNIASDAIIIILPMPVLRRLNLATRQKQALMGIFAIGGFVCLISILRLQSLISIANSSDPTYDNTPAATWSSAELNVGIICSSLPTLRPLISRYLPSLFSAAGSQRLPDQERYYGGNRPSAYQLSKITATRTTAAKEVAAAGNAIGVVTVVEQHFENGSDKARGQESTDSLVVDLEKNKY